MILSREVINPETDEAEERNEGTTHYFKIYRARAARRAEAETRDRATEHRPELSRIGLVGDTYTILLLGNDTDGRYCLIDSTSRPAAGRTRSDFCDLRLRILPALRFGTLVAEDLGTGWAFAAQEHFHVGDLVRSEWLFDPHWETARSRRFGRRAPRSPGVSRLLMT